MSLVRRESGRRAHPVEAGKGDRGINVQGAEARNIPHALDATETFMPPKAPCRLDARDQDFDPVARVIQLIAQETSSAVKT
jgi:hypothetical protein